ncbi:hypothetical protein NPIL_613961 [Nephila pilipes]|uniref:Uncharacterized protein n=1 Tax=Nephila pilipes TaxID=299642 RepID=A0A8X6PUF9_NEPPI|nr:hypothetical protein NPIL_613961 [Nephila pilipes]
MCMLDRYDECLPQQTKPNVWIYAYIYWIASARKVAHFKAKYSDINEALVHHYEPESKHQSMVSKHPGSHRTKKFKTSPSVGKLMLTQFWDEKDPLLDDFLNRGIARYSGLLGNKEGFRNSLKESFIFA